MTDYILKFPSKAIAEQFGIANGFAAALLRIDTPITGGTGVITGTAIFYKAI